MLIFKHLNDLRQLQINTPIHHYVKQCINSNAHLEGYLILIEAGDRHILLPELQANLETMPFEGVFKTAGYYHAVYFTNNEFALEFIIPNTASLSPAIRANLERHL